MPEPITAEELAQKLGLSRATVSIVLRGDAERRKISRATTDRVLEAARTFNYIPNQAARMLRRQRTDVIGVIFPNFSMGWAERVMEGMLQIFGPSQYSPFMATHRFDPDLFMKETLASLQRRDDGLICFPLPHVADEVYQRLASIHVPVVLIGDRPVDLQEISSVVWDAGAAARVAVQHLVDLGRKRIGFLGIDYPMEMNQARIAAYHSVLKKNHLPAQPHHVFVAPSRSTVEQIIEPGLDRMFGGAKPPPDAIFALNDGLALPLLDALYRRDVRVPEDVAVVSMGDLPLTGHSGIGLSTMREPVKEMGKTAAEVVLRLIANPQEGPVREVLRCEELHARRTTVGPKWIPRAE